MRKYITAAIACLMVTVELAAQQQREFPALQINFKDGSSEIVAYPISGYRYGVDNPQPGDYIRCHMEVDPTVASFPGNLMPSYSLTDYGQEALAHCDGFGLIFSDAPIDTEKMNIQGTEVLYTILDGRQQRDSYLDPSGRATVFYEQYCQELGSTYYLLAYYSLDGVMHYSEPLEQRIPKRMADVIVRNPSNLFPLNGNTYVRLDYSSVSVKVKEHYGVKSSLCIDDVVSTMAQNHVSSLSEEQVKQMTDSVDVCDDGNIYFLALDTAFAQEVIAFIDKEADAPYQMKAADAINMVLMPSNGTKASETDFVTDYASGYPPVLVSCDASWGVADNQYISTNVPNISTKAASLAIRLNHLMLPGRNYQVTVSLAPETDESSTDTLDAKFYMLMADGEDKDVINDTYPMHRKRSILSKGRGDKYTITNAETGELEFTASPDKVTTYTFEYTPERLVYNHALKMMSTKTTAGSIGKNIRLISVYITPVKE